MSLIEPKIAVFDFDGTLYRGDSFIDFCVFYYTKKPLRIWYLFFQIGFFVFWKLRLISTTQFKSWFVQYLLFDSADELNRMTLLFWKKKSTFNEKIISQLINHKNSGCLIVVASASPKLFIKKACETLQADHIICTELVAYKGRHVIKQNCRGGEKLKQIKACFPKYNLVAAYSDNEDDLALLKEASQGFLVDQHGNTTLI